MAVPVRALLAPFLRQSLQKAFHSPSSLFDARPAFRLVQSPDPEWTLGSGMRNELDLVKAWRNDENGGWKSWSPGDTPQRDLDRLLTSAVVPRPIAFVSTLSADGIPNLAPFSYFQMASHDPPLLSISFTLSARKCKDTLDNILATKEFTVNLVSEPFVEAVNATAVEAPPEVNEWVVAGLEMQESTGVKPARVRDSAVSFECKLYHSLSIQSSKTEPPKTTANLVLGLITKIHVRKAVLSPTQDTVDPVKLKVIARMGGPTYAKVLEGFELKRVAWKKVMDEVSRLATRKLRSQRSRSLMILAVLDPIDDTEKSNQACLHVGPATLLYASGTQGEAPTEQFERS